MQITEPITMAMNSLWSNKLRSSLTLLGVIIGVFTIIGMQSIINGFRAQMYKQMSILGANVFQVQKFPAVNVGHNQRWKYRNRKDITWEEAKAIQRFATHVEAVGAENWQYGQIVRFSDKKTRSSIVVAGGTPEFAVNNGYFVQSGRFLTDSDVLHARNVAIIGVEIVEDLFPFRDPLGETVHVSGKPFRVIGVLEERGSQFGDSRDNRVIMPLSTWNKMYGVRRSIHITVRAKSSAEFQPAIDEVTSIMRTVRKVSPGEPNDFEIFSSSTLKSNFDQMSKMVRYAAIGIASISLLVAGIGIMNIMLVTVTERTREIGIRKAIGAQRSHILSQFLIESVILSIIGGLIGVVIGISIAKILSTTTELPFAIPGWAIIVSILFCSLIGLVFGMYPAAKAAAMDPIESLRYE